MSVISKLQAQLDEAYATIAEQQVLLDVWRKRVDHADIEMCQARISRDGYREKLMLLNSRLKGMGIVVQTGSAKTQEVT